jgi:hypothetical protein
MMSGQTVPASSSVNLAVTRVEVVDHIGDAFAGGPLTRSDLLVAAQRVGARAAVLELLERLPDHRFSRPNELWTDLKDVPIEL